MSVSRGQFTVPAKHPVRAVFFAPMRGKTVKAEETFFDLGSAREALKYYPQGTKMVWAFTKRGHNEHQHQ